MPGGVFICHASSDAGMAQRIVGVLERAGVRCWIAPRDIEPGEEYTQAILDALEAAPAVVLVFSEATNQSPHVRRELETTVGSDTRIIPVRLEPVEPARSLRYFIGTAQWLDTVGVPRGEWQQTLVRGVRRALGQVDGGEVVPQAEAGPPPAVPPVEPAPPGTLRRWLVPAAVALVVALIAGVVGFVATRDDEDPADPAGASPSGSAEPSPSDSTKTGPTETQSATPSPTPAPSNVVFEEDFDQEPIAFRTDTEQFDQGSITGEVVEGEYFVTVEGIPEGNKGWFTVSFTQLRGDWSISVDARSRPATGGCGLVIASGPHTLSAILRRESGDGELMWFIDNVYDDDVLFQAQSDASGAFSLSRRGDVLVVLAGGDQVAEVPVKSLGRPNTAGVAVVGAANTCVFDNFRVEQAG